MNQIDIQRLVKPIAIIAAIALLALNSFRIVKAGTIKVVTRFGRVTGRMLRPGAHFIIPIAEGTITYNTKKVTYEASNDPKRSKANYTDIPVDTTTLDGQQIELNYTARFSIDPTKAGWIANNIGTEADIVEKIVKTDTRIHARNIAREFNAADLYTGNISQVQKAIEDRLRPIFEENGLLLDEFGIRSIAFTDDYISAIEAKQIEKERVITEENIAKQEEFRKEARITRAEGQAEEQRLQRTTLNDALLMKMWIEKWSGEVPNVVTGDQGNLLFQIPNP
ncbi:prohibitin family protein [Patescibacteria group bacterium]|nr:prohibitin family protein [Patescibacteria group bacterium]